MKGTPKTVRDQPSTALLFVEISDSTLAYDKGLKSNLYAEEGIADYWVLDVNGGQLLIHRDPIADPTGPREFRYTSIQVYLQSQSIAPLAEPGSPILVSDLLP